MSYTKRYLSWAFGGLIACSIAASIISPKTTDNKNVDKTPRPSPAPTPVTTAPSAATAAPATLPAMLPAPIAPAPMPVTTATSAAKAAPATLPATLPAAIALAPMPVTTAPAAAGPDLWGPDNFTAAPATPAKSEAKAAPTTAPAGKPERTKGVAEKFFGTAIGIPGGFLGRTLDTIGGALSGAAHGGSKAFKGEVETK